MDQPEHAVEKVRQPRGGPSKEKVVAVLSNVQPGLDTGPGSHPGPGSPCPPPAICGGVQDHRHGPMPCR